MRVQIHGFRQKVLEHEGAAVYGPNGNEIKADSHEGIFRSLLSEFRYDKRIERIAGYGFTADSVAAAARDAWAGINQVIRAAQLDLEARDYHGPMGGLPMNGWCAWDYQNP